MPIKRIGVKKYIWVAAKNSREISGVTTVGQTNFSHRKTGRRTKGSFQNPIQCWRKAPAGWSGGKTPNPDNCACVTNPTFNGVQEVFKDTPCVDSNGTCLRGQNIRIRSGMLQTNAQLKDPYNPRKKQNSVNYNYKQYLQRKCKTIKQNSFNFIPQKSSTQKHHYRGNCSQNSGDPGQDDPTNCCFNGVTYKPNNKKYSTQGAVSAGARLLRLKYDAITKTGREQGTDVLPQPYRGGASEQNKIVKTNSCQDKMLGSGKRIFRSGGPRRKPRLVHRQTTDPPPSNKVRDRPQKPLTCGPRVGGDCCNNL